MAKRVKVYAAIAPLLTEIDKKLKAFAADVDDLSLREKVQRLVPLHDNMRSLGVTSAVLDGLDEGAAMKRIEGYLVQYAGQVIDGVELDIISGISEYARRIRQLRVEEGYRILTGASPDAFTGVNLKPDQYLLATVRPDQGAAKRWHIANRIRKRKVSSKERLLAYMQANVGKVVTTEELSYVAKDKTEFGRRTRELRTEDGYAVATRFSGRPDLNQGEYILLSADRIAEPHDRQISEGAQKAVYQRDKNTCRVCGWSIRKLETDPRFLELHHVKAHAKRGSNDPDNLIVLCNQCHDEVHANRIRCPRP